MRLTCKVCLLGLLFPVLLNGQETGLLRMNPNRPAQEGEAAVWGGVEEGYFKPLYASPFQWSAGADASLTRHGKTSSWTGALSVKQAMGSHMYSSMLLEPEYYPFDLLEFYRGTKSRQEFKLETGFLSDLGYEWAAGLKASVQGGHVSKRQDIPHSSFGVDARLEPVLTYVMDDEVGFVSSYRACYRMETLRADENAGELFLDEGMRYGTIQALEGNGSFPVRELSHGFSELFYSPEFSMGLELIWKRGQAGGMSGERFKFPGSTLTFFFQHTVLADGVDHMYGASYKRERDQLRLVKDGGFSSLSDRKKRNLELKYEARFLHGHLNKFGITLDGNHWSERAFVGPSDQNKLVDATAKAHAAFSFGVVDVEASAQWSNGWWLDHGQNYLVCDSRPEQLTEDWNRKLAYFLAKRVGAGGTITGHLSPRLYLQLYAYWYHALDTSAFLSGHNREIGTLKVGYKF